MGNKNDLIILEQLPIIKYKLEQLSVEIKDKVDKANSLIVNEDTVKEVKQVRANLTKEFNELESQRKKVKQAIMLKYEEFEEIYKANVSSIYKNADAQLKEKIDSVETSLKEQKRQELYDFAMEYFLASNIQDYVTFDDIGLNITLSASMKSLKEQIVDYCDKVVQDFNLIKMEEFRDEILVEYKKYKDFYTAKQNVITRHNLIQQEQERRNALDKQLEEIKQTEEKVEEVLVTPIEIEEKQKFQFTITCTLSQAKKLKEWLKNEEIEYE